MKDKGLERESGMISVEAVLSLVPFLLVILGIISFINIYMVHNRVQYAMFQAGSQISAYTYLYQALGLREADLALKGDIDKETEEIDSLISQTQDFIGKFNDTESKVEETLESGQETVQQAIDFVADPQDAVRNLVYLAIEGGEKWLKSFLLQVLGNGIMSVYLDQSYDPHNPMNTDAYLEKYGVKGGISAFDYSESDFLSTGDYQMIDIVVEYDMEIYFFKLFLKDSTIHVTQRCVIPAWLDGDGTEFFISE